VDVTPRRVDVGDASSDEGPDDLDLSPRPPRVRRARRWPAVTAVVVIAAAIVLLLFQGLGDATVFFYNADEAVERREALGTDRFRLQGTVVPESVEQTADGVDFTVVFADVEVDVHHTGEPPDLFQEEIPVVVEGSWTPEGVVESDAIVVKHTEVYEEDNADRLDEAETGDRTSDP
jgi:cytochrome c-type biogenesis protein CcmE